MGRGKALSVDLRERIVAAVQGGATYRETAARFEVGEASVSRFMTRLRRTGSVEPVRQKKPVPTLLDAFDREMLRSVISATPDATLAELVDFLFDATNKRVSHSTMGREVQALNITRKKKRSSRTSVARTVS